MKPVRTPIIRYPVSEAAKMIRSGELTLQKKVGGSAELLGGSNSLGVSDHIYAWGWLSQKQVSKLESLLLLLTCLLLSACTIVPHTVRSGTPSFSDGKQNSSLVSFDATGAVLDSHGRDRYNALIDAYGASFAPPLAHDEGLTPEGIRWHIDNEHLAKMELMNLDRRSGRAPVKKGLLEKVKDAL